jgi:hypothetical protein
MFQKMAESAPRELTVVGVLRMAPPAPWIDPAYHGKPVVVIVPCFTGKVEDGERLLAPVKAFGRPIGDVIQRRSYVSQQSLLDATQPKGRRYYWKSEFVPRLSPGLLDFAIGASQRIVSPHSAVFMFQLGGAIAQHGSDHSAVGNRDAGFVINLTGSWEKPSEDDVNVEWARAGWRELKKFSTGGTYVNFLTEEEGGDRVRAAYGANLSRLAQLKAKWDPQNLFRVNKNIAPAD